MIKRISEVSIFWSWNGLMEKEEIESQLLSFSKEGITGVFLHSRAGLKLNYLEEDWFQAIGCAIKYAEKIKMDIYLYDEDGWPSGFAGGRVVKENENYSSMPVKIEKFKPKDGGIVLFKYIFKNNKYLLSQEENADLYVNGYPSKHYVDLLNPEVVDTFIKVTHEKYYERFKEYFGNVVKGIFTDEPQIMQPYVFNQYLDNLYKEKYKEDIKEKFYLLNDDNDESKEFRVRYFSVVSELFHKNYTLKIATWCENHNIVLTGHFAAEDGLCSFNVNCGVMEHYINYQMPGIDFLGRRLASPVLVKQIESVKNQFNKPKILSEALGCTGWNTNFKTFKHIWNFQAGFGLNVLCCHIGAYSMEGIRKRDYPAFFSYQEPWFDDFHSLTNSFKNTADFISSGRPTADSLVISPLLSVIKETYYSNRAKIISTEYRHLIKNLLDSQVFFELTDETILSKYGKIENGKIVIGSSSYSYLYISESDLILKSTYDFILGCIKEGIKVVIINDIPKYIYDNGTIKPIDNNELDKISLINNRIKIFYKYLDYINYPRTIEIRSGFSNDLVDNLTINRRKIDEDYYYLICNSSDKNEINAKVKFSNDYLEIAENLETLEFKRVEMTNRIISLNIKPMQTILLKSLSKPSNLASIQNFSIERIDYLKFDSVDLASKNILTIDKAKYRYDGSLFSDYIPVIKLQDEAFTKTGKVLEIKYEFYSNINLNNILLGIENVDTESIYLDGCLIKPDGNYFIDKSIKTFSINNINKGNHEIILKYLTSSHKLLDVEHIFETERNRFSYPVVIENIYVIGDFSLLNNSTKTEEINYYHIESDKFILDTPQKLNPLKEISSQNNYFYRGTISYKANYNYQGGDAYLQINDFDGVLIKVYLNDKYIGNITDSLELSLKDYLVFGNNTFRFDLISSNRNTLGPHHHYKGEPNLTGVHTFKGERGFEDDFFSFGNDSSTWNDEYAFVPFMIKEATIKIYK